MSIVLSFLMTTVGRWVASGLVIVVAFSGWLYLHDKKVEQRGAAKAVAKIENANDKAVQGAHRARASSRDSSVRGKRDPYTSDH